MTLKYTHCILLMQKCIVCKCVFACYISKSGNAWYVLNFWCTIMKAYKVRAECLPEIGRGVYIKFDFGKKVGVILCKCYSWRWKMNSIHSESEFFSFRGIHFVRSNNRSRWIHLARVSNEIARAVSYYSISMAFPLDRQEINQKRSWCLHKKMAFVCCLVMELGGVGNWIVHQGAFVLRLAELRSSAMQLSSFMKMEALSMMVSIIIYSIFKWY